MLINGIYHQLLKWDAPSRPGHPSSHGHLSRFGGRKDGIPEGLVFVVDTNLPRSTDGMGKNHWEIMGKNHWEIYIYIRLIFYVQEANVKKITK